MAGTAAHRELIGRRESARFAVGEDADDAAIRRLLRENPMEGSVSITFEREPAYARGTDIAGGRDRTIVAYINDRLVCMGRCTRRLIWVDGREASVGYLSELRLDKSARGRLDILKGGYKHFQETESDGPAEAYFTSIGAENVPARRLLESSGWRVPAYDFLAEFETLLITVPRRVRKPRQRLIPAAPEHLPSILRLLNEQGRRHQLSAVWSAEKLQSLERHGLPLDRFRLLFEGNELVACGALWDQRLFRQTVIQSYSPALSLLRHALNAASRLFGRPQLPPPGAVLASAFLSPLTFAENATSLMPDLVEGFSEMASALKIDFLTVGLPAESPEASELRRRFHTRTWRSRFYQVRWPVAHAIDLRGNDAICFPDVALL